MFSGLCPSFCDGYACVKSRIGSKLNRHGTVACLHEQIVRYHASFTRAEPTAYECCAKKVRAPCLDFEVRCSFFSACKWVFGHVAKAKFKRSPRKQQFKNINAGECTGANVAINLYRSPK